MITERSELYGVFQKETNDRESKRDFTVIETDKSLDSMNELYRLLQEGIDDVKDGRTKPMKDSISYIREKIS